MKLSAERAEARRYRRRLKLYDAIAASWAADTSADDNWTPERPLKGQCAVTALVVQDYLDGELLRTTVDGVSHYWNRLADGTEIDLTRDQFDAWNPAEIVKRGRSYVLDFPATERRYLILSKRVALKHSGSTGRAS